MEKFEISVSWRNQNNHFEVFDYMHHEGEQCKYEVFKEGKFIGSFEPDGHRHRRRGDDDDSSDQTSRAHDHWRSEENFRLPGAGPQIFVDL